MSKKNLSKSAIEGGRHRGNKWDRRHSHTEERSAEREYCKRVLIDPEYAEEILIDKKDKVNKEFTDKLGPMYRWLRSQIGRPWSQVHSEVFKTFDIRTTAGRHIIFDHLLSTVETESTQQYRWYHMNDPEDPTISYFKNDFYVDKEGILKERRFVSRKIRHPKINSPMVAEWLNGRILGKVGHKIFWFIPTSKNGWSDEWKCQWDQGMSLTYLRLEYDHVYDKDFNIIARKPVWKEPFVYFSKKINCRQHLEFSKEDYDFWKEIPSWYQEKMLEYSPTNK